VGFFLHPFALIEEVEWYFDIFYRAVIERAVEFDDLNCPDSLLGLPWRPRWTRHAAP